MSQVANQMTNNIPQSVGGSSFGVPVNNGINNAYNCAPLPSAQPAVSAQPVMQSPMVSQTPLQNNATYIPVQQPQPAASSSGVNIVIYNPSVNPAATNVANSNNSYNTPVSYPPNYYLQQPQAPASDSVAKAYLANTSIKDETKTEEKAKTEKANIVQLTDEYIKTLENYLNNPNVKVREMGVKELMERFKEHKSRYNDIALTNLLNKALQDGSKNVRFLAMSTLDAGYAQGDALTQQLLQRMQSSKDVYGEDAMFASEIMLKNAGNKVEVDVPVKEDKKAQSEKGK